MDALNNPSTQVNVAIGVGVAGIGWIAWRLSQRKRLVSLLETHPRPDAVAMYLGDPTVVAAGEITFTNTKTAAQAAIELENQLPPPPPPWQDQGLLQQGSDLWNQGSDFAEQGQDFASSLLESGKSWWGR
jgi:hypothetical protein